MYGFLWSCCPCHNMLSESSTTASLSYLDFNLSLSCNSSSAQSPNDDHYCFPFSFEITNNPQVSWSHPLRTRGSCRIGAQCLWLYLCQDFNHQKFSPLLEKHHAWINQNKTKSYKVFQECIEESVVILSQLCPDNLGKDI
jgi:hypothetical protein